MEHIKLFNTHTSYIEYASGGGMLRPNVIHCLEENEVHYRPSIEVEYLTFIPLEDGTFSFNKSGMSYSLDEGETWKTLEASASTENVSVGTKVLWKASGLTITETEGIGRFSSSGQFDIRGNIMSLVNGDDFVDTDEISDYQFCRLFSGTSVVDSSKLLLPSTALTESCYRVMFAFCESMEKGPKLPAMTLAPNCYRSMFQGSTITQAPELPATTLADYCYVNMFRQCQNLIIAPELPSTTLSVGCYGSMFHNCQNLKVGPSTIGDSSSTIPSSACMRTFEDCISLVVPPKLPAKILNGDTYNLMFKNCKSLTVGPELLADKLMINEYREMFNGCSNLSYVKMMATDISGSRCLDYWLEDVSPNGTIVKNSAATWTGHVPSGWKIETASS